MEIYRTEIKISKEFIYSIYIFFYIFPFLDKLFFLDNCATYNRNTFFLPKSNGLVWRKFRSTFHDLDIRRNIRLEIS